jgi:hypothetical protein
VAAPPAAPALESLLPPTLAGLTRTSFTRHEALALPYRDCGTLAAVDATYGPEHVSLIDMGTAVAALCIFGAEKTLDGKPIDDATVPQGEGYERPGHTFSRRGRYYVRVAGSVNSFGGGKNALALTHAILAELPNPSEPDPALEHLRALPMIGRIPGSDRYLPEAVFGFTALPRGYSSDYGCGEAGLSIVHLAWPAGVNAEALVRRAQQEAVAKGYAVQSYALGEGSLRFDKPGARSVYVVRVGNEVGAIEADAPLTECAHLPRELVRVLAAP